MDVELRCCKNDKCLVHMNTLLFGFIVGFRHLYTGQLCTEKIESIGQT